MNVPDHIPAGMSLAAGYRFVRDGLRIALTLPEDELRDTVAKLAEGLGELADALDPPAPDQPL